MPPIPFKAAEVAELRPHWEPVARALAATNCFDYGAWENQPQARLHLSDMEWLSGHHDQRNDPAGRLLAADSWVLV